MKIEEKATEGGNHEGHKGHGLTQWLLVTLARLQVYSTSFFYFTP